MSVFNRKYGVATVAATHITIPIIKRGVADFAVAADWTPAAGDVKVTKDGGTPANIATLPTHITDVGWRFVFSAAELQCKRLNVRIVDSATKAVEDQHFIVETYGDASAMIPIDFSDIVRMGLTGLPNAVAGAGGGLPTRDNVNTEVDTALADINLDHLLKVAVTGSDVIDNSVIAKMVSKAATADWDTFLNTDDSLEAIRDRGDAAWTTATAGSSVEKYPEGGIFFDSGATPNTNTTLGVDGTSDNPVTSEDAAMTLSAALGTDKIFVKGNFLMANLTGNLTNKNLIGYNNWGLSNNSVLTTAAKELVDVKIKYISITGATELSRAGRITISESKVSSLKATNPPVSGDAQVEIFNSSCGGSIKVADLILDNCRPMFNIPIVIDMSNAANNYVITRISGEIQFNFMTAFTHRVHANGAVVKINSTSTAGTIELTGDGKLEHVQTGTEVINTDAWIETQDVVAILADTADIQPKIGSPNFTDLVGDIANLITRAKGLDEIHDDLSVVDGIADLILVDTGTTLPAQITSEHVTTNANIDATQTTIGTPAGASVSADIAAVKSDSAAIKAKTDNLPEAIKKNTAVAKFPFGLVLASDNKSPATGKTVTAERSIDGGAFVSMTNSVVEISDGDYYIDLATADTNGTFVTYKFSATGANTKKIRFKTAV